MNLLFVHDRFGALAGAEANVLITATELGRRGHRTALLHGPPTGRAEAEWAATFPDRFSLGDRDATAITREALGQFRPDVIYIHKLADLAVLEALADSGRPLVRMVHDHDLYCLRSYKYNYFTRRICTRAASAWCVFPCLATIVRNHGPGLPVRWASYRRKRREIALNRRCRRLVVVSRYMRDELLRNGFDPARIEIHPPVPRPGDPDLRSSFPDRNLILYAGQIIRGKGVDVLLRALALVRQRFECVILGDGNHRRTCEALARRLGLADRVTFRGFVPPHELREFYRECTVVALSSVWPEPIATIGLEVMRYALPVVAFDAGGIRDWLTDGHNGYLVPWMDHAAYADRLGRLLADKNLARRLGENGLRFVTEHHDFDRYIRELETLFRQVVTEPPAPAGAPP